MPEWKYTTEGDRGQLVSLCSLCNKYAWYKWFQLQDTKGIKIHCIDCHEEHLLLSS